MDINLFESIPEELYVVGSFVAFIIFWGIIITLISRIGGWNKLTEVYPDLMTGEKGEKKMFVALRLSRSTNYNGTVIFEALPTGLRLSQFLFFRFGHENLFIPWSDIMEKDSAGMYMIFELSRSPEVKFSVKKSLGGWILAKKKEFTGF